MTRRLLAAALLCAFVSSCGGGTEPSGIDVGSIVAAPNPIVLMQEQTAQLQVSVLDPDGALLSGVAVSFTSANSSIVTVSNVGLVTSVGPAGSTSISIKAGNKTQSIPVTVTATSASIIINPEPRDLPQLGTLQLEPTLFDIAGDPIPGATFHYSSSDPLIATVNETGLVTSVGPAGVVTVAVSSGDIQATGAVSVHQVPGGVRISPQVLTLLKGGSAQIIATVLDAVGQPLVGFTGTVSYSAEPASLLTISGSGLLTAGGTSGTGTVTVSIPGSSATASVKVVDLGALTGSVLYHIPVNDAAYGVAISDAGAIFGVSVQGTLYRGNVASNSLESTVVSGQITIGVATTKAGDKVYVTGSGGDGLIEVDPATGLEVRRRPIAEQLFDVVLSPDEQTIYVAGETGSIHVIDAATLTEGPALPGTGFTVVHLLHHPTEPLVYASGVGQAREVNTQTGAGRSFSVNGAAQGSAIALAGDRLFVAGEDGNLDVVDLVTADRTTVAIPDCGMYDIVALPNEAALLVTCTGNGTVKLLDPATLATIITIPVGGDARRAAVSADGSRAVVANQAGWFDIIQ